MNAFVNRLRESRFEFQQTAEIAKIQKLGQSVRIHGHHGDGINLGRFLRTVGGRRDGARPSLLRPRAPMWLKMRTDSVPSI
jgi:hypothetical protein